MTQNSWTEKHRDFAIANNLPQSAWSLWEYLVLEGYQGSEIIDLRDFNKWVERHRGKAYDRRTLKSAAIRLEEAGVISLEKGGNFTAFVKKWIVKPIGVLLKPILRQDKRSKLRSPNATLEPSNDISAFEEDITTTTSLSLNRGEHFPTDAELLQAAPLTEASYLEQNIQRCEEAGIEFTDSKEAVKVLAHTHPEDVTAACDYYLEYIKRNKVGKPAGFLRRCLERRWWEKGQKVSFFDALLSLCAEMGRIKA